MVETNEKVFSLIIIELKKRVIAINKNNISLSSSRMTFYNLKYVNLIFESNLNFSSTNGIIKLIIVVQIVKHLSAMQQTRVLSLGWKDPLEKEMATHCSTLAWKIPWMEEPGRL